jgi:hypothetical protein
MGMGLYSVFVVIIYCLSIYCFILFIKLSTRGIKALDIYISQNKKEE